MKDWRLIAIRADRGDMQMAIDEAMLIERAKGRVADTLRFYTWNPPAVTIGYFQSLALEVDKRAAEAQGVDIIRRYTGGGAVFHHEEITYSLVMDESQVNCGIAESYAAICQGIVLGLGRMGITATFKPINDIMVASKKISGNAQTRRNGILLQHGTVLLDIDIGRMFSLLKVPDEKIRDKMIKTASERVTSLNAELKRQVTPQEAASCLAAGFEKALGIRLVAGELTDAELLTAEKLCKEKYGNPSWSAMR